MASLDDIAMHPLLVPGALYGRTADVRRAVRRFVTAVRKGRSINAALSDDMVPVDEGHPGLLVLDRMWSSIDTNEPDFHLDLHGADSSTPGTSPHVRRRRRWGSFIASGGPGAPGAEPAEGGGSRGDGGVAGASIAAASLSEMRGRCPGQTGGGSSAGGSGGHGGGAVLLIAGNSITIAGAIKVGGSGGRGGPRIGGGGGGGAGGRIVLDAPMITGTGLERTCHPPRRHSCRHGVIGSHPTTERSASVGSTWTCSSICRTRPRWLQ